MPWCSACPRSRPATLQLWLIDDRLGLPPACQSRSRPAGLLVIHPSPVLDGLSALCDKTWADAVPVILGTDPIPDGTVVRFGYTTRSVFGLLAAGLTDQAIARRLGCSECAVQRHI